MDDNAFAWWLVGLVDGEGHFGITRYFKSNGAGPYFRCVFRVTLAVNDRALLERAHARTSWGRLYQYDRKTQKANGSPHRPFVVWTVNTKSGLLAVAEFFTDHALQSKKAAEFAVWNEAARAHAARTRGGRGHRDQSAFETMERCYNRLLEMRRY